MYNHKLYEPDNINYVAVVEILCNNCIYVDVYSKWCASGCPTIIEQETALSSCKVKSDSDKFSVQKRDIL